MHFCYGFEGWDCLPDSPQWDTPEDAPNPRSSDGERTLATLQAGSPRQAQLQPLSRPQWGLVLSVALSLEGNRHKHMYFSEGGGQIRALPWGRGDTQGLRGGHA